MTVGLDQRDRATSRAEQQSEPDSGALSSNEFGSEVAEIRRRYESRSNLNATVWNPLLPYNLMLRREKWENLAKWIDRAHLQPVHEKRILEIGCGLGEDLLYLISMGFSAQNIVANELLEARALALMQRLPVASEVFVGDPTEIDFGEEQFDIVYQSVVFSSLLNDDYRRKLANKMWSMVKRGGGVLWYDFIYDNPRNPHVRGVPVHVIRGLFPEARLDFWRLTLAPPIGRFVTKMWPGLYTVVNMVPLLRTHVMCWIQKRP